jgi:hypothetical protein
MPAEIEVTQPDGSSETPALDELETQQPDEAPTEEPEAAPEAQAEAEPDEVVVTIGDEAPAEEPERAPEWVRELRKSHRELQRKVREYEEKAAQPTAQTAVPTLGAKPKLEDHDYDTDKYETALEAWYKQRDVVEAAKRQQQQQAEAQRKAWQDKLDGYAKAKADLRVKDYDDAEATVQESLNTVQQGVLLQGSDNPALVVYALGKNPKKAKELASITDPVKFAFAVAKMEAQLKVNPAKRPPAPERAITGSSAPISGTVDSTLERLRAEAEKTGDMTKVIRYRNQLREKQAAKR